MATVPVSKPMLPARICRIKSGSRIVPIPINLQPCRLAVKGGYARARVEVRIRVVRSKPTCWDQPLVPADTLSTYPIHGSVREILPPSDNRFCALQRRNEKCKSADQPNT